MHNHVMLDIETLGKTAGAAIASIGAVKFDPHGDWIGDSFHIHVSLENCVRSGLVIDASTVIWWLSQPEDARAALAAGQAGAAPLITALDAFSAWMPEDVTPWCNGASFDFAILAKAYDIAGMPLPWQFYKECDMRLLKNLNKDLRIERAGIHHSALDDAIHQARTVQHILQTNRDMEA